MANAELTFRGVDVIARNTMLFGERILFAVRQLATFWAGKLETFAKENASWVDRTGNARNALHAWVEEMSDNAVMLYLSHGVDYGVFLEVRWAGKFGIVWATIEAHLNEISDMLRAIFR